MCKKDRCMGQPPCDLKMLCKLLSTVQGDGTNQPGRYSLQHFTEHIGNLLWPLAFTDTSQQVSRTPLYQCNNIHLVETAVNKVSLPMATLLSRFRCFWPFLYALVDDEESGWTSSSPAIPYNADICS